MSRDVRNFGFVRNWNIDRGFGFITPDGGTAGRDIFCHVKGVRNRAALSVGARVSFFVEPDPRDGSKVLASDAVMVK